jgi:predicted metal-dependent peptidase
MNIHDVFIRMRLSGNPRDMALAASMRGFRHVMTDRIPTAGTDGIIFVWNPAFLELLSYGQLVGLVAHEWLHMRLRHSQRFEQSVFDDHRVSNEAMDDEINSMLLEHGYELPPDGCHPSQIGMPIGKSWEVYYPARAKKAAEKQDDPDAPTEPGKGDGSGGSGDFADGCHKPGTLADELAPDAKPGSANAKELADGNATVAGAAMRQTPLGEAADKKDGRSGGTAAGTGSNPDGRIRATTDGDVIEPSDGERWQDVVIDTFRPGSRTTTDWGSRSRRLGPNAAHWLPGTRKRGGMHLALVIDVSGSCHGWFDTWASLATELVDEVRDVKRLTLLYHDDYVVKTDEWQRGDGEVELSCPMGGGTNHVDCCEQVAELPVDGVIYLTDAETRQWADDAEHLPTVTVLPGKDCRYRCPWGTNVFADE